MSADANNRPAAKEPEAEVLDFEVVDDGRGVAERVAGEVAGGGGQQTMSPEDFMSMAPHMIVGAFRDALKEKLKQWFIRNLIATTVAVIFWEHDWVRVVFYIWAFFAGINLAFLLYGWFASRKHAARISQIFSGAGGGVPDRMRDQ